MRRARTLAALAHLAIAVSCVAPTRGARAGQDNDQTLRAMRDEMARSKTRRELKIPGTERPVRPYYVEYRLLDLDVKEIVAEFGTLVSSTDRKSTRLNSSHMSISYAVF